MRSMRWWNIGALVFMGGLFVLLVVLSGLS
jgi:hypothetical protein